MTRLAWAVLAFFLLVALWAPLASAEVEKVVIKVTGALN